MCKGERTESPMVFKRAPPVIVASVEYLSLVLTVEDLRHDINIAGNL